MRNSALSIGLTSLMLATTTANAGAPLLLNYQGHLAQTDGTPENGTFSMQFSVYDAATAGAQLPTGTPWSETQNVTVADGVFNVLLGSVTALPATLFHGGPTDSAGSLRFLNVVVDGETLEPRKRIGSAAYAISPESNGTAFAVGVVSRSSGGVQVIPHGLGRTPRLVEFAGYSTPHSSRSEGAFNGTSSACIYNQDNPSVVISDCSPYVLRLGGSGGGTLSATATLDDTNISLSWDQGSGGTSVVVLWRAYE